MAYSSECGITAHDTWNSALKIHQDKGKAGLRNNYDKSSFSLVQRAQSFSNKRQFTQRPEADPDRQIREGGGGRGGALF